MHKVIQCIMICSLQYSLRLSDRCDRIFTILQVHKNELEGQFFKNRTFQARQKLVENFRLYDTYVYIVFTAEKYNDFYNMILS